MKQEKRGVTCGQWLAVIVILLVGFAIIMTVGQHAWSLTKALNLPEWLVILFFAAR